MSNLRINCGSGQRKFGMLRSTPEHNTACVICGVSAELHGATDPPYHPKAYDVPHRYVPVASDSWVNVDINPKWEPDVIADGAHMPMFATGSADLIVSHHVAEHAGCGDAGPMFRECRRILADNGSMIVCVPDMWMLAHGWLQGRITTQIYMTNVYGAYMDNDADRHRWGFDLRSLSDFLLSCGFSRVKQFDWRKIPGADIAGPDWWILSVEAFK